MSITDREERRWLAGQAMMGLLADHKDHEDERKFHWEECDVLPSEDPITGVVSNKAHYKVYDETCAQAVARLAVEHADALIAELGK